MQLDDPSPAPLYLCLSVSLINTAGITAVLEQNGMDSLHTGLYGGTGG